MLVSAEIVVERLLSMGTAAPWVVVAALLVWLAGLVVVLWGSKPKDRAEIIKAYAACQPFAAVRRRKRHQIATKEASGDAASAEYKS